MSKNFNFISFKTEDERKVAEAAVKAARKASNDSRIDGYVAKGKEAAIKAGHKDTDPDWAEAVATEACIACQRATTYYERNKK